MLADPVHATPAPDTIRSARKKPACHKRNGTWLIGAAVLLTVLTSAPALGRDNDRSISSDIQDGLETAERADTSPEDQDDNGAARKNCISLAHVRRTEVIDDKTVLFYLTGGQIRQVRLAFSCSSLRFYRSFGYRVYTNRLCAGVDSIISRSGSHCPIAEIRPITKDEAEALRDQDDD